ncbi:MAG: TRAP transporter substrate-binding protein [Alcaligenaceae bacterium]|nr:TRAP transporter substrate-binding protein [Alcaligenaceae bacterium]
MSEIKPAVNAVKARRKFLTGATAAGAGMATLGFPMVSNAQTINFRFQSTWPAKDIFHEYAQDYASKVNAMSGGRLKIDVLPSGSVVGAFGLLDAVSTGTLDGGHGVLAYHYGKSAALALWGSGPAFGMDPNMVLSWHQYGGGKQLLEKIYAGLKMDVVSFVSGPMPTQPLGWFKKPITKTEDFKGLKFRTVGLSIEIFNAMGASVQALGGADIVPAMDRGVLDAAEFNNATSDRLLGFADVSKVCMLQSFHQSAEQFEILFNKKKFDALPADLKSIITVTTEACSAEMSWKAVDRYSTDFIKLQTEDKVRFYQTPKSVLEDQLKAWDVIIAKKAAENADFKAVLESQREFARRAGRWQNFTNVDYKMAYDHYFAAKKS